MERDRETERQRDREREGERRGEQREEGEKGRGEGEKEREKIRSIPEPPLVFRDHQPSTPPNDLPQIPRHLILPHSLHSLFRYPYPRKLSCSDPEMSDFPSSPRLFPLQDPPLYSFKTAIASFKTAIAFLALILLLLHVLLLHVLLLFFFFLSTPSFSFSLFFRDVSVRPEPVSGSPHPPSRQSLPAELSRPQDFLLHCDHPFSVCCFPQGCL